MRRFTFRGPIAPVFTPFNNDGTIIFDVIPKYAKYLLDKGLTGILVNGTSGEGMSLSVSDRKTVAEKWMGTKKSTNHHVMVQVGGAPLPDVLELAKHSESIGVDSILCLPELYFKPTNSNELTHYLKLVSSAAPKTPLLYYHIPSFTNVSIHMGKFLNEVDGKIPTLCGIKFTSPELEEGLEAVNAHDKKFAVFLGAETLLLKAYKLGFDSAIATVYNLFPDLTIKTYECFKSGNLSEAEELQGKLTDAATTIIKYGTRLRTMKALMNKFTPINVGQTKDPVIPLTDTEINQLIDDLKKINICPRN